MRIASAEVLGRTVLGMRKGDWLSLEQAAAVCGVSYALMSALENGKPTARLERILQVLGLLGDEFKARPRDWTSAS